ncbi:MAG: ABC transporter permease [Bacteroidota bacterium]
MSLLLRLAWRNVWRNKRRSIITILAVTFAAMFSIAMRGIQLGTYEVNIRTAVSMFSSYLQIQRTGYQENPSLQRSIPYEETLESLIKAQPAVTGYAPRIYADGLVSFKDNSLGVAIIGIDPNLENSVSILHKKVDVGKFFRSDSSDEVVVGYKLLRNLRAAVGDKIVVLTQGYYGSLGNMLLRISGTIKTGSQALDGAAVFMGFTTAQELLDMGNRVTVIALSLTDLNRVTPTKAQLNQKVRNSNLTVLSWDEVMPELKQSIELDNIGGLLFLGILIVVVAFGILNTVLMSVTERFREFGILLSVGMPQMKLVTIVFIETIIIAVIGLLLGNMLAAGINYYIVLNPIVFSGDFGAIYEEYGFLPRLESSLKLSIFINSTISILVIALASFLYPGYKLWRLQPLKGIRHT